MNDQELREVFDYHGKERLVDGKSGAIGKNKDVPVHVKSFYPPGELARKAKLLAMLRACGVCIRKNHVDAALKEVGVRLKTRRGFTKPVRFVSVCVPFILSDSQNSCEQDGISFDDFKAVYKTQARKQASKDAVLEALQTFDKDGKGRVSLAELKHVMTHCGEKISSGVFDVFVKDTQIDGSGLFDYRKFVANLEL